MFRGFHWIGVSFIFIASILLLITSISSPVIGDIGILKVTLTNKTDFRNSAVTFGTFGHCVLDVAPVTSVPLQNLKSRTTADSLIQNRSGLLLQKSDRLQTRCDHVGD